MIRRLLHQRFTSVTRNVRATRHEIANGQTGCTPCQNKTGCPAAAPFCNYGYGEMH